MLRNRGADQTTPIVILEESMQLAAMFAELLKHAGFRACGATSAPETRSAMRESAPERVLLLASSSLAARLGPSFRELRQHDPAPLLKLTCTQPEECPLHPGSPCPDMGCLKKPHDFTYPGVVARLNGILAQR